MDATQTRVLACMQCGKCTGGCPESGKTPFNVRMIMRKKQFKSEISETIPWYCTSCGACTIRCPRDVKPSEVIIEMRSAFVEEGDVPASIQKALENTDVQKNPWGRSRSKRGAWSDVIEPSLIHVSEAAAKRLLFTCCIQAYDPRCMVIPVSVSQILRMGGYEFGVLGEEEACCGNEIRRIGETGLFEVLQEENMEAFKEYGLKEIIALSPHCMNTFKKEYGDHKMKIVHYTQVVSEMITKGMLKPKHPYPKRVIYHDPCFLGKQNGVFDEPRNILKSIEGLELLEFSRNRETSLCCEG
ncbi:MAG TPA: (Fe-S)-binding protein [Syntrophorhabdaceae bacterium]|nr:(Fe-S)-binding protein [Syntrophorhabdaceae bacterium]